MRGRILTSLSKAHTITHPSLNLTLSHGRYARLSPTSCLLENGSTTILSALTHPPSSSPNLQVDYRIKAAALGIIPATWQRRELSPAIAETLASRLIDRSLRPAIHAAAPAYISVSVLAASKSALPGLDVLAVNAAAGCVAAGGGDVVGAARVARVDGQVVSFSGESGDVEVFVAVNEKGGILSLSIQCERGVQEESVLQVVREGVREAEQMCTVVREFGEGVRERELREGKSWFERYIHGETDNQVVVEEHVRKEIRNVAREEFERGFVECAKWPGKAWRAQVVTETQKGILHRFENVESSVVLEEMEKGAREAFRAVVGGGGRVDGRGADQVREIRVERGVLGGGVHGSALFERGDTQVLTCATVGLRERKLKTEEYVNGGEQDFFVHYAFPGFATGEMGGNFRRRREVGHGALVESALRGVVKVEDGYCLRVSNEVLGSDGSSSMASVCGGSLALMECGVDMDEVVAGVAIGGVDGVLLTDILGMEDHFGEFDAKVCGSENGVTAVQMDVKKREGVSVEEVERILEKGRVGRRTILQEMDGDVRVMPAHCPRVEDVSVNVQVAVKMLLKEGAKGLKAIEERSGVRLTVDGKAGVVRIEAGSMGEMERAKEMLREAVGELEIGSKMNGTVGEVRNSYAVVDVGGGVSGILHISKMGMIIGGEFPDARRVLMKGDQVEVVVVESDRGKGVVRFGLSKVVNGDRRKKMEAEIDSVLKAAKGL